MARLSLTKSQLELPQAVELLRLCQTVTADGRLTPQEIQSLQQWLADADDLDIPAAQHLRETIQNVMADSKITSEEVAVLHAAIEAILPLEARKEAIGFRRLVEAEELERLNHQKATAKEVLDKTKAEEKLRRPIARIDEILAGSHLDGRARFSEKLREGDTLALKLQPGNPHDRNAIAVMDNLGRHVGYLPRDTAASVAPLLAGGHPYSATVKKVLHGERGKLPIVLAHIFNVGAKSVGADTAGTLAYQPDTEASTASRPSAANWVIAAIGLLILVLWLVL